MSSTGSTATHGLCLLSIDGGGIRGISSLIMLKRILERVQVLAKIPVVPRPAQVFDLAGGTSTGGLIVLMLFRLRMSIDDAIDLWNRMSMQIFSEKKKKIFPDKLQNGQYKATRLENAVLQIIVDATEVDGLDGARQYPLYSPSSPKCFVSTLCENDLGTPLLLCSYRSNFQRETSRPAPDPAQVTIVEAARAATAAPTYFKPATIGEERLRFVNGGLCCNNPVKFVVEEAQALSTNPISLVLSLGTGKKFPIKLPKGTIIRQGTLMRVARMALELAMDTQQVADSMALMSRQSPVGFSYTRLNVDRGLESIELDDWQRVASVRAETYKYLDTVTNLIDATARVLLLTPFVQDAMRQARGQAHAQASGSGSNVV